MVDFHWNFVKQPTVQTGVDTFLFACISTSVAHPDEQAIGRESYVRVYLNTLYTVSITSMALANFLKKTITSTMQMANDKNAAIWLKQTNNNIWLEAKQMWNVYSIE